MRLIKQASGKTVIKLSKDEWLAIGNKTGWDKFAAERPGGQIVDRSLEAVEPLLQQLQQVVKGVFDQKVKGELNRLVPQFVQSVTQIIQQAKQNNVGFRQNPQGQSTVPPAMG